MPILTEEDVRKALVPSVHRTQVSDDLAPGLTLRSGGVAAWQLRITDGARYKVTLGRPPEMTLDVARQITAQGQADHRKGRRLDATWSAKMRRRFKVPEPAPEPIPVYVEPPGPWTWRQGAEAWLHALAHRGRSPSTIESYRKSLIRVLGVFNDRMLADVTGDEVQAEIDRIARDTPFLAFAAMKAARPYGAWISRGVRHDRTGHTTHRLKALVEPDVGSRRTGIADAVTTVGHVADVVALCRAGVFHPTVCRAVETTVLTGLSRATVTQLRQADVSGDVLTVPGDLLKRHQAIRIPLTDRLRELLTSDDREWIFPQPGIPKTGPRKHLPTEGIGRSLWESGSPSASEMRGAMTTFLHQLEVDLERTCDVDRLSDSGGDDNEIVDGTDGRRRWEIRGDNIYAWGQEIDEALRDGDLVAKVDAESVREAMRQKVRVMRGKSPRD